MLYMLHGADICMDVKMHTVRYIDTHTYIDICMYIAEKFTPESSLWLLWTFLKSRRTERDVARGP